MNDLPQEIREQLAKTNLNSPNIKQQKEAELVKSIFSNRYTEHEKPRN